MGNPPASVSHVLGLQAQATMSGLGPTLTEPLRHPLSLSCISCLGTGGREMLQALACLEICAGSILLEPTVISDTVNEY